VTIPGNLGGLATIEWVLVDGNQCHVSEFAELPPKQRPRAHCLECGDQLILALGKINVYHARHLPGADCILTKPDTWLHQMAERFIAEQLTTAGLVTIREKCQECKRWHTVPWEVTRWTHVKTETALDGIRPDITLHDGSKIVGAVEIYVTHKVELQTVDIYERMSLPWLEVAADKIVKSQSMPRITWSWKRNKPLPVRRRGPGCPGWRCSRCGSEQARRETYKQRNQEVLDRKPRDGRQYYFNPYTDQWIAV